MEERVDVEQLAAEAKKASRKMMLLSGDLKNKALEVIAQALDKNQQEIFKANAQDLRRAEEEGLAAPLLKRLKFDEAKLQEALAGIKALVALPDPVGKTLSAMELDKGLELYRVSSPLGVLGVIFESRPDALIQISSLALKSGNSLILKGGREAAETNSLLARLIAESSIEAALPAGWISLLESRAAVNELLKLNQDVDLIIPRGSNEFVRYIMGNTTIPVLGHADGICHLYVDRQADIAMALKLSLDAKCQYVAVCNALETLLVHQAVAKEFLPMLAQDLTAKRVVIRGCSKTQGIIPCEPASEEDWRTEYLDYILSIKIVANLEEAIEHINYYGSHHTDTIVTEDRHAAAHFLAGVDSACVFWNTSTRFSDGYRFGLGAEVGIATGKLHARGPVGLEGLLTYKWLLLGQGQTVAEYSGPKSKAFRHSPLGREYPLKGSG